MSDHSETAPARALTAERRGQHDASPGVWRLIGTDIGAWKRVWQRDAAAPALRSSLESLGFVWNYCGLRATLLYRLSHAAWRLRIPLVPGMIGRWNLTLHGLDIPASVPIGPGLYVPHPVGTVVMAHRIGANATLIGGLTIGMRDKPVFPTLGDGVFIGAGARVLGDITVGDGASIGANAVVLKDVPAGATAVGVPARIVGRAAAVEEQP